MILMDLGAEVHGRDHHFKFYESTKADLSSEIKKKSFSMFLCLPLALATQKERRK